MKARLSKPGKTNEQNLIMEDLCFRLNFNLSKKNEIYHHSSKERLGISNIVKFGCEML